MGGSQSVEIPGGGTEGYHVLKVNSIFAGYRKKFTILYTFRFKNILRDIKLV